MWEVLFDVARSSSRESEFGLFSLKRALPLYLLRRTSACSMLLWNSLLFHVQNRERTPLGFALHPL